MTHETPPVTAPQDRQKAIVEAAQELARVIELKATTRPGKFGSVEHRAEYFIDNDGMTTSGPLPDTEEVQRAFAGLAHALALPETPAIGADKARAIADAAREFVRACEPRRIDGDGLIERDDGAPLFDFENIYVRQTDDGPMLGVSAATALAVRDLLAALALPEPEWTTTPPTEPGFYWTRQWNAPEGATLGNGERRRSLTVLELRSVEGQLVAAVPFIGLATVDEIVARGERCAQPVEWIPVPIAPPSTGGTNR